MSRYTLRNRRTRPHRRHAFTLVELLVVIGIIAVLMGILLPALGNAREQSRKLKCLSNLRHIAVAAQMYTTQNNGWILPVSFFKNLGDPFGRNWTDTWATTLVAEKLLPYPNNVGNDFAVANDNVFHCPSGLLEEASVTTPGSGSVPSSRTDARGSMGYGQTSTGLQPGLTVWTWYGINAAMNETDPGVPSRMIVGSRGGRKYTQVRRSSEMAFFFDGIWGGNLQHVNANRLNARHNKRSMTNIAFFDGHAESFPTASLPGGVGDANPAGTTFGLTNLAKYRFPIWRLDQ